MVAYTIYYKHVLKIIIMLLLISLLLFWGRP